MGKELHITIDNAIGSWKEDDRLVIGYMDYMLDGALAANPDATDLYVGLDCPGGCTYVGAKIYNRLVEFRNTPGNTVTMVNENMAASYGAVLMQAATPGKRKSYLTAPFLVHKPLYSQLECVNGDDLASLKAELDMVEDTLAAIFVESTGRPIEQIKSDFKESLFISAQVALEKGYIDEIIEATPKAQPKQREAKAVAWYTPSQLNQTIINQEQMAKTKEPTKLDKLLAFIKNLAGEDEATPQNDADEPAPVAATSTLENGDTIYHDGDLAEGVAVFSDAEMTNALADGDYVLSDARTLTVAAGLVEAISEPEAQNSADLEAANAEITRLKGELEAATAQASAKDQTIKNVRAELAQLKNKKPAQNHAADNSDTGGHPLDKVASKIKSN